ncbi:hypothetical protein [Bosea vaviloviae]
MQTTRSGDFELDIGQDISIGYLSRSHTMLSSICRNRIRSRR